MWDTPPKTQGGARPLREQNRGQATARRDRCRIFRTPDIEELQQFPTRTVIVEGTIPPHDGQKMVCRPFAVALDVQNLGKLYARLVIVRLRFQMACQRGRIAKLRSLLDLVAIRSMKPRTCFPARRP
jgi:hypothetical protein